jgi:hypothetical protein
MRFFFAPVAFVAFSCKKVGDALDANRKTAQMLPIGNTKKKKTVGLEKT